MVIAWFKFIITSVRMMGWAGLDQPGWGHLSSSTSQLALYMLL